MPLADLTSGAGQRVVLAGGTGQMEVFVDVPEGLVRGLALVGHPQPLMGGSAQHKIARFLASGLREAGWFVVTPNFRGVGASSGVHDHGAGEASDAAWLAQQMRGSQPGLPLGLVGFSFGAFVLARSAAILAESGEPVEGVVLAGFPVGQVEGGRTYHPPPPVPETLIVHGEMDGRVPLKSVLGWCAAHGSHPVVVVPGADHFFAGKLLQLRSLVLRHLAQDHA